VQAGQDKDKYIELHNDKPLKLAVKVRVPVKEFPKVCFASLYVANCRCMHCRVDSTAVITGNARNCKLQPIYFGTIWQLG